MLIRKLLSQIPIWQPASYRRIHTSLVNQGVYDLRDMRDTAVKKKDDLPGEGKQIPLSLLEDETSAGKPGKLGRPFEYIDENLMDKLIDNVRFRDIPILHIVSSRNNTKLTLALGDGTSLACKSAGTEGFKHCRKGTTVAAQAVAKRVLSIASDHDINMVRLVFNGLGPGRSAAYKSIELSGLKVVSLSDRTESREPWLQRPRKARRL